jgi:hypothetical protein
MRCQVPLISILQKPLDTAWYLVIQGADFTVSPLFRSPREKNHKPSYRHLNSTLSDGTPRVFVGACDLPIPLDVPI